MTALLVLNELIDKWWEVAKKGDEEAIQIVIDLCRVKMALEGVKWAEQA